MKWKEGQGNAGEERRGCMVNVLSKCALTLTSRRIRAGHSIRADHPVRVDRLVIADHPVRVDRLIIADHPVRADHPVIADHPVRVDRLVRATEDTEDTAGIKK